MGAKMKVNKRVRDRAYAITENKSIDLNLPGKLNLNPVDIILNNHP
jgi:hypothetical protein